MDPKGLRSCAPQLSIQRATSRYSLAFSQEPLLSTRRAPARHRAPAPLAPVRHVPLAQAPGAPSPEAVHPAIPLLPPADATERVLPVLWMGLPEPGGPWPD